MKISTSMNAVISYNDASQHSYLTSHISYNWSLEELNKCTLQVPFIDRNQVFTFSVDSSTLIIETVIPDYIVEVDMSDLSEEQLREFSTEQFEKDLIKAEFEIRINDIFLALQIAQPARYNFGNIKIYQDDKTINISYNDKLCANYIAECTIFLRKYEKDIIKGISFNDVWDWLLEIKDFWDEVPNSKIGIYLNYYKYFCSDTGPLSINCLEMSIECLLAPKTDFIKNQIKGRLKVLLKDFYDENYINKAVDNFYKLRSKINHGKQKLNRPTILADAMPEVINIDNVFVENGSFLYSVVMYCLQYMIITNRYNLNFDEKLVYTLLDE